MKSLPPVILCGVREVSAFAVTDALIRKGIKIYAFDIDRNSPGLFHSGISEKIIADELNQKAAIKLAKFGQKYYSPVLFPFDDETAKFISDYRNILKTGCKIFMPPKNVLETTLDKQSTFNKFDNLRLTISPTIIANSRDSVEQFLALYGYPSVLKMRFGSGGRQQIILNKNSDLDEINTHKIFNNNVILQKWIPGPITNLISVAGIRRRDGKISHLFSAKRLDVLQSRTFSQGVTTCIESTRNRELLNYTVNIMEKLELVGIYELEFKKSTLDNRIYLLEINPRFWAWVRLPIICGVDFAEGYLLGAINEDDNVCWQNRNYRLSIIYWRALLDFYSSIFQISKYKRNIFKIISKLFNRFLSLLTKPDHIYIEEKLWTKETWKWIIYYLINKK